MRFPAAHRSNYACARACSSTPDNSRVGGLLRSRSISMPGGRLHDLLLCHHASVRRSTSWTSFLSCPRRSLDRLKILLKSHCFPRCVHPASWVLGVRVSLGPLTSHPLPCTNPVVVPSLWPPPGRRRRERRRVDGFGASTRRGMPSTLLPSLSLPAPRDSLGACIGAPRIGSHTLKRVPLTSGCAVASALVPLLWSAQTTISCRP